MQYILTNTLAALLYYDHATLLGVNRMLSDKHFRKKVLARRQRSDHPCILAGRVRALRLPPEGGGRRPDTEQSGPVRHHPHDPEHPRTGTQRRRFPTCHRPRPDLHREPLEGHHGRGQQPAHRFVPRVAVPARRDSRAPTCPRKSGGPFYLYIDEFQNFTTVESLASILSEARKYRLALTLAHQYTAQLGDELRAAVFGNVGTIVCLRVGFEDARILAEQLNPLRPTVSLNLTRTVRGCASSGAAPWWSPSSWSSCTRSRRGGAGRT